MGGCERGVIDDGGREGGWNFAFSSHVFHRRKGHRALSVPRERFATIQTAMNPGGTARESQRVSLKIAPWKPGTASMPAGLLLCALLSAVAVEAANDNHFDRQSDDGRSSHTNLTSRSCAAALAHLHSDMVEAPAGRGASKAVGLGLTWWPLPSRVDLASSAATIDDQAAATATTAQDACGVARQHSRLSDNASLSWSIAEVQLSSPMGPRFNASQRSPCRSELCDKNAPGAKFMEEIQGGPHGRVLSSPAVAMRGMDDKPCADAEERAADSAKARSVQVRPQCSHSSSRHFFVIRALACYLSTRTISRRCNMNPRAEAFPACQCLGRLASFTRPHAPLSPSPPHLLLSPCQETDRPMLP